MPEDSLLQSEVELIKDIVDLHTRNLFLHTTTRGLYPINVLLITLHQLHDTFKLKWRRNVARHARLHKFKVLHIDNFHACCMIPRLLFSASLLGKKIIESKMKIDISRTYAFIEIKALQIVHRA